MSYLDVPTSADGPALKSEIREYLLDLGSRKEFRSLHLTAPSASSSDISAYKRVEHRAPRLPGLQMHGGQNFARNFDNPDTPTPRLVLNWQTGTGKSIGAIGIGQEFVAHFKKQINIRPANRPTVFIIGFTKSIIQAEMLRHPEFGFVSAQEIQEMKRLRASAEASGNATTPESRHYGGFVGVLKRRITDRSRGGYYRFYGYKEFANRLFLITRRGGARNFSIQSLYARKSARKDARKDASETLDQTFIECIDAAVKNGNIEVNRELLLSLHGGLIIADEIHNTYNIQTKNNYGIAIQYVLDKIGAETPRATPRLLAMSATVTSGSPMEIIDLLNFLVPLKHLPKQKRLRREDFFRVVERGDAVKRKEVVLLPGALDMIGRLSAGRVSFLLDEDEGSYPRRIFEGEPVRDPLELGKNIAYLKFIKCPMAPFHERSLDHLVEQRSKLEHFAARPSAIPINALALYDMSFPNPKFAPTAASAPRDTYGLYLSTETPKQISAATSEWRAKAGVGVRSLKGDTDIRAGDPVLITGPYLSITPKNRAVTGIGAYSTKYHRLAADIIAIIRDGPGKIMVYHPRVRRSGVLAIQELMRMNGIIGEQAAPNPSTLCGVCGVEKKTHKGKKINHAYVPARFAIVNSEIDRCVVARSIARYNRVSNAEGHEVRILIGSRMIREGFDLKAVRFQLIASLPTDIPTLIQVLGRAVRKNSHISLPQNLRDVHVRIYVSTAGKASMAPEVIRYAEKMRVFLVAQKVEMAIRSYAVDAFLNFEKAERRLQKNGKMQATIDGIPYEPVATFAEIERRPETKATFEAYGYGDREVAAIRAVIQALFEVRPVWTYEDLWKAVHEPNLVKGLAVDPRSFSEESFAIALDSLAHQNPSVTDLVGLTFPSKALAQTGRTTISRVGVYFIQTFLGPEKQPVLDIESYVRDNAVLKPVRVRVSDYVREARTGHNFSVRLALFEKQFTDAPIENAFVEFDSEFHFTLLRKIVEAFAGAAKNSPPPLFLRLDSSGSPLARLIDLYWRFRILVGRADVASHPKAEKLLRSYPKGKGLSKRALARAPIGFVATAAVRLYDFSAKRDHWYDIPRKAIGFTSRFTENDIVVGYIERRGAFLRFKVRPPIHELSVAEVRDIRSLARGAVCETRPRREQELLALRLKAIQKAKLRELSSAEICVRIRSRLFALEERSRNKAGGMAVGVRFMYLFNDKLPTITLNR